jgi:hypothetical protein
MTNDGFLDELAASMTPVKPRRASRDLLLLALIGAGELGLFLLSGAARTDIASAVNLPILWWKLGSLGVLTVAGMATALRSLDPTASPHRGLRMFGLLAGAAVALGWVIDALAPGGDALWARLRWRHGVECVFTMTALSIPAIVALGLLLRRGAPTDRRGSALAAGAASAAWGAFVFAFRCPDDDPFYVAVWYLVGCSMTALAGRVVLPRIIRW